MESKKLLIGLTGDIGSGKTTVANYLKEKHEFTEYTFSDPLKKIGKIFGFTDEQLYGTQQQKLEINKYHGISGRDWMQKFGTEVCREALPKVIPNMDRIWVKLFEIFVKESVAAKIVVSDIRFADEAKSVTEQGGIIIRIIRKKAPLEILQPPDVLLHASETEKQHIRPHVEIENLGNLGDLYKNIDTYLELISRPPNHD